MLPLYWGTPQNVTVFKRTKPLSGGSWSAWTLQTEQQAQAPGPDPEDD